MAPDLFLCCKVRQGPKRPGVGHAALSTGGTKWYFLKRSRLQLFVEIERIALLCGSIFYATTIKEGKNLITAA